jgi:periplasmic divalent cation tolerance protein
MDAILVYMTAGSDDEARRIGRALVEEKLAACVNILPGMESIYRWEGRVESAAETVIIAKTREPLFDKLAERVRGLHSYSCPCVIAWPLTHGAPAYLDWIRESTTTDVGLP